MIQHTILYDHWIYKLKSHSPAFPRLIRTNEVLCAWLVTLSSGCPTMAFPAIFLPAFGHPRTLYGWCKVEIRSRRHFQVNWEASWQWCILITSSLVLLKSLLGLTWLCSLQAITVCLVQFLLEYLLWWMWLSQMWAIT